MKHLKIKKFSSEAKRASLRDQILIDTLNEFFNLSREEQLKYSLGAGLYKLRIATKEVRGKSGGSRSILAFKKDNGIYWLHLFSKNDKENGPQSSFRQL
jgi:hypothetical protein